MEANPTPLGLIFSLRLAPDARRPGCVTAATESIPVRRRHGRALPDGGCGLSAGPLRKRQARAPGKKGGQGRICQGAL